MDGSPDKSNTLKQNFCRHKRISFYVLLFASLFIVIIITFYLNFASKEPNQIVEQASQITQQEVIAQDEADVSDWKTYRNKEYGFEFGYPPDLFVSSEDAVFFLKFINKNGERVFDLEKHLYALDHPTQGKVLSTLDEIASRIYSVYSDSPGFGIEFKNINGIRVLIADGSYRSNPKNRVILFNTVGGDLIKFETQDRNKYELDFVLNTLKPYSNSDIVH